MTQHRSLFPPSLAALLLLPLDGGPSPLRDSSGAWTQSRRGACPSRQIQSTEVNQAAFQQILADDGTFTLQVPIGWEKMGPATFEGSSIVSKRGEGLASGMVVVYANQSMLQTNLHALSTIYPPLQLVLMSRLLSRPLSPLEVVRYLFPQIANGAMQNVRILGYRTLSAEAPAPIMVVRYLSTLFPQQDAAFASLLPPRLRTQYQVTTETVAVIWSPINSGLTWTFSYLMITAPRSVFEQSHSLYAHIYESFRFIPEGLARKIQDNERASEIAEQMRETTRQVGRGYWLTLGGLLDVQGPGGETQTISAEDCSGGAYYQCPLDPYPRCYGRPPVGSCAGPFVPIRPR